MVEREELLDTAKTGPLTLREMLECIKESYTKDYARSMFKKVVLEK